MCRFSSRHRMNPIQRAFAHSQGMAGMMKYPLTITNILNRARTYFPKKQVVTRLPDRIHRYTYADLYARVCRLANALSTLGVGQGDRVGVFGWNTYRYLEAYFAAPCMGAVVHTINIRLAPNDLVHIINHAKDKVLLIDEDLLPAIEAIAPRLETVQQFVVMTDGEVASQGLPDVHSYEGLMEQAPATYNFPQLEEDAPAGLCYTSATTGNPKGVTYDHRGLYLHTLTQCMTDSLALSERDVILPVVPMFHANTWGVPYTSAFLGATLVLPGQRPDSAAVCNLIQQERVTISLGVPTIWIGVLDYFARSGGSCDLSSLRSLVSGGSAVPPHMFRAFDELGIPITHAYGMTEATPLVTICNYKSHMSSWDEDAKMEVRVKQGVPVAGLEIKLVNEEGEDLPWDGEQQGELLVRGPWIASEYFDDPRYAETFVDGWYHTGDVVTVDQEGYVQLVDRAKDMVKSGGEWISSVDLEAAIMAHPGVYEAAVIGIPHEHWQERPLACVVPTPEQQESLDRDQVLAHLEGKFARWWLPDVVVFIDEMPKTAVGKFDKKVLRQRFANVPNPNG